MTQLNIDIATINFAVWLLIKSGTHAGPFNRHDLPSEVIVEFLDADTWIHWCRNLAFKQLIYEYYSYLPASVKDADLQRVLSYDPGIELLIQALQSFPDEYPKHPYDWNTLCYWDDIEGFDLFPNSNSYISDRLSGLWELFKVDYQSSRITNRDRFDQFMKLIKKQKHHYFLVRYQTQRTLELTPNVSIFGECY
ncbi:hypothetical protein [Pantanalinema sp. GBBB05]|uniref:hypothetical protein n=1 Tax=Pantanalinema sp. GBBB05 TaxID=2604139 RepID=UPI001D860ECA|nr:hypothetical protein [Pantanalinema sp. GBBB05]